MRTLRIAAGLSLFPLIASALVGMVWTRFLPSPVTVGVAAALAVVSATLYGWMSLQVASGSNPRRRAALLAVVGGAFGWIAFSTGIPWALNALVGSPGSMTFVVDGWRQYRRRTAHCFGPTLRGVPPLAGGERTFCLPPTARSVYTPGTSVVLRGTTSWLGITVEAPVH